MNSSNLCDASWAGDTHEETDVFSVGSLGKDKGQSWTVIQTVSRMIKSL